jgi:hypothetical protein
VSARALWRALTARELAREHGADEQEVEDERRHDVDARDAEPDDEGAVQREAHLGDHGHDNGHAHGHARAVHLR